MVPTSSTHPLLPILRHAHLLPAARLCCAPALRFCSCPPAAPPAAPFPLRSCCSSSCRIATTSDDGSGLILTLPPSLPRSLACSSLNEPPSAIALFHLPPSPPFPLPLYNHRALPLPRHAPSFRSSSRAPLRDADACSCDARTLHLACLWRGGRFRGAVRELGVGITPSRAGMLDGILCASQRGAFLLCRP